MFSRLPRLPALGALVVVLLVAGVLAGAAIADNNNDVFYACEKDGNIISGSVMVNQEPKCKNTQTLVGWNSEGPMGLQGDTGPEGPAGAQGPQGPAGEDGVSGYELVSIVHQLVEIPRGKAGSWTVECPAGKVATGGGYGNIPSGLDIRVTFADLFEGGFSLRAFNNSGSTWSARPLMNVACINE